MILLSSPFIIIDELTDKINELNSELSSSIDSINTNINAISTDLTEVAANVSINNTASSTGTLSQKLSSIYNQIGDTTSTGGTAVNGNIMAKLNTLLLNSCSTIVAGDAHTLYNPVTSATPFSLASGDTFYLSGTSGYSFQSGPSAFLNKWSFTPKRSGKVRLTATMKTVTTSVQVGVIVTKGKAKSDSSNQVAATDRIGTTSYTTKTVDFEVQKGAVYYMTIGITSRGYSGNSYISSLKITYDIQTDAEII